MIDPMFDLVLSEAVKNIRIADFAKLILFLFFVRFIVIFEVILNNGNSLFFVDLNLKRSFIYEEF